MKLTTTVIALLLYAYSFGVEARVGTQVRETFRASVTAVKGALGKGWQTAVIAPLALVTTCSLLACGQPVEVPNYADIIGVESADLVELGVSSAAAADYYSDPDIWKSPADYEGKLVVFRQNNLLELGVASDGGRHNELVVTDMEHKNGRRTIIKVWQIQGVYIYDSGLEGKNLTVNSADVKLRSHANFGDEAEARRLLRNKKLQLVSRVVHEFSNDLLMITPLYSTGNKPNKKGYWSFLDLGIRLEWDQPLQLFTSEDKVTWAEEE